MLKIELKWKILYLVNRKLPVNIKYWNWLNLSNKNPVRKQPTIDPIELIINMNEICPIVTPIKSFKSNRVGPITPSVTPRTENNIIWDYSCIFVLNQVPKNAFRNTNVLTRRCHGYFSSGLLFWLFSFGCFSWKFSSAFSPFIIKDVYCNTVYSSF